MPFQFSRLAIPDVILIEPRVFPDERGFFMESYKYSEFAAFGIKERFVQDNHSHSRKGVLRGLHYQKPPKAQGKLVRVVVGEIFDVAVDIRSARGIARAGNIPRAKGSPTYGKWVGEVLSAENKRMLYIPPGFAHGFCVLSEVAEVLYKTTEEYAPEYDAGIRWNDPEIGINWPIEHPILSAKDAGLPFLRELR
jgi:dTDP-4-dehydrorhamnose 3,5-epimerase